jgi:aconitate hydratase
MPSGEQMPIYDAAMRYQAEGGTPLVVSRQGIRHRLVARLGGQGHGLLGVKAVIAESFERIHRSNLVGMGVLPLQFKDGASWKSLGLDGTETFDISGIEGGITPRQDVTLTIRKTDGTVQDVALTCRIDTAGEVDYYRHGGVLQFVLRNLMAESKSAA